MTLSCDRPERRIANMSAVGADHALAARVATQAGNLLLDLRAGLGSRSFSADEIRKEGDRRSHEFIVQLLTAMRPDDAVLSEEGALDPARLRAARVWIVDPLDGTREFGELGRTDWAVHVALVIDGAPAAGAVSIPGRHLTLTTDPAPASPPPVARPPRLVVSRTRPSDLAVGLCEQLGGDLIAMGSAGAKAMAVVLGEADVYVHSGGQYEWDSAAPVAVAAAAGLHVSRLDGSGLRYNRPDPWLPDLLVCRPDLRDAVDAALWTLHGNVAVGDGR